MVKLIAPETVIIGEPFTVTFSSESRVAGRLRLTSGTEALPFVLDRGVRLEERAPGHRVRGKQGSFQILEWGEPTAGTEIVLRFEGAKAWIKVLASEDEE
ncbi:MAG: hypothetical protein HN348_08715 [Proteobacteria bacterium]|nr:hypothetical protein [Pseudomonadota bacterium]